MKFNEQGLIPVITQDYYTKDVLILSYMNEEAYNRTVETGKLYYYSRSRNELWKKGETSGNTQELISLTLDCDGDSLLAIVKQKGVACHTGEWSCFHKDVLGSSSDNILKKLDLIIKDRIKNPKEKSYTNYLMHEGRDKILKKIGEEASEIIIGSKNESQTEIIYEVSDFIYHLLVLLNFEGIELEQIYDELENRFG